MSRLPDANLKMVPSKELEDLLMMNRIIEICIIRIYLFVFNDTIEGGRDPGAAPQDTLKGIIADTRITVTIVIRPC